jgi:hypothetical protein
VASVSPECDRLKRFAALALSMALAFDRGLGLVERRLAGLLLEVPIASPERPRRQRGIRGLLAYFSLADPVAWRAVGCFVVRIPCGTAQFVIGFLPWGYGGLFVFFPLLAAVISSADAGPSAGEHSYGFQLGQARCGSGSWKKPACTRSTKPRRRCGGSSVTCTTAHRPSSSRSGCGSAGPTAASARQTPRGHGS